MWAFAAICLVLIISIIVILIQYNKNKTKLREFIIYHQKDNKKHAFLNTSAHSAFRASGMFPSPQTPGHKEEENDGGEGLEAAPLILGEHRRTGVRSRESEAEILLLG